MKAKTFHIDGYGFRIFDRSVASTKIIVMEWSHPNYGYWSDFAVFVRGNHQENPETIRLCNQAPESFEDAKKEYPQFKEFFMAMEGKFFGDFGHKLVQTWQRKKVM